MYLEYSLIYTCVLTRKPRNCHPHDHVCWNVLTSIDYILCCDLQVRELVGSDWLMSIYPPSLYILYTPQNNFTISQYTG